MPEDKDLPPALRPENAETPAAPADGMVAFDAGESPESASAGEANEGAAPPYVNDVIYLPKQLSPVVSFV